jgi:hypothetical protein
MRVGQGRRVRSWSKRILYSSLFVSRILRMVRTGIGSYDGRVIGFGIALFDQALEHDYHQLLPGVVAHL